jgi:hypothetical protein
MGSMPRVYTDTQGCRGGGEPTVNRISGFICLPSINGR